VVVVAMIAIRYIQIAEWFSVHCVCGQKDPEFDFAKVISFFSISALNIFNIYPAESVWSPCKLSSWTLERTENQVLVDSCGLHPHII
jgi:hypothetical protein